MKLLRDSAFHKAKIGYLILAQFIAFFGITTVYMGNIMVNRDFEENFAQSDPAHLLLTYPLERFPNKPAIPPYPWLTAVEERPMTIGDIQTEADEYMKALFIGVEDMAAPQINRFSVKGDCCDRKVYIEQNGRYFFDKMYLKNVRLISAGNDTLQLGPAGMVHDTRLPPSRMEHTIYVFIPIETFKRHFPYATQRLLLSTNADVSDKKALLGLGKEIQAEMKTQHGIPVSMHVPSQEHPHQNIADGISYLMKLLGGSLGLLGGVFLVLILLTWLYPQIPDMGILKSLGATHTSIQWAYLLFILLLSLLACIPSVYLGYIAARAFNAFIAFTQNFTPVDNAVSMGQWVALLGICFSIPLLLAWIPIRGAVRKSVRYAQNLVFNTHRKSIDWLNQWLPSAQWIYVGNNLFRNLVLFFLTTLLVVTGLAIALTGYNLIRSLEQEMAELHQNRLFDYALDFHVADSSLLSPTELPEEVAELRYVWVEGMEVYNPLLDIPVKVSCARITPAVRIPQERFIVGKWEAGCTDCLYFSQGFSKDFAGVLPGDAVKVRQRDGETGWLTFGGILKLPENSSSVFRPVQSIDRWNQLYLLSNSDKDQTADLKEQFAQQKGEVPHIYSAALTRQIITDHLEGSFFIIAALGLASLILSLVGILLLINLNLLRRERDIGILKSIGASPRQTTRLFEREILVVLSFAILVGVLFSFYLSQSMCFYFGDMVLHFPLNLKVHWGYALLTIVGYLAVAILSIRFQISRRLSRKIRYLLH